MKAVRIHQFGGPEVLIYEDAPQPELKPGEVLVQVRAVGVNRPDFYVRDGYKELPPQWRRPVDFPAIPGSDISGTVAAVADDVLDFAVGDDVFSMVRFPAAFAGGSKAYAEYTAVPATDLAKKPPSIDHEHAAGAPMSLLTAWQFLIDLGHTVKNPLQPNPHVPVPLEGRTVLVTGAAGGVGHFVVQIAKWKGARVIAVASGAHAAFLRDLDADEVIDYTQTAPDSVRDIDLVVDAAGSPTTAGWLKTLKRGGALFALNPLGFDGADEAAQRGVTFSTMQVRSNGAQLAEAGRLLDNGTVRVAIDSTYALSDAAAAHARAAEGHIRGKIVLKV